MFEWVNENTNRKLLIISETLINYNYALRKFSINYLIWSEIDVQHFQN